jgi:hypothetical protein
MRRKNLFLSLSPNKRNDKVGIYEGSSIVIFGAVFIVAYSSRIIFFFVRWIPLEKKKYFML